MDYHARRADRLSTVARWERRHAQLGAARLLAAGLILALGAFVGWDALYWMAGIGAVFVVLLIVHSRVLDARDRAIRAVDFYDRGLMRLAGTWAGHGDTGDRFVPPAAATHLYCDDLDLFGRGGAFELLGTCRTEVGQATLAAWLLAPASPDDVRARQAAVRELVPQLDLRERLSVEGAVIGARLQPDRLRAWAVAERTIPRTLQALALALPVGVLGAVVWRVAGGPAGIVELALLLQVTFGLVVRRRVLDVIHAVDSPSRDLDLLERTARILETMPVDSPRLAAIQAALRPEASRAIRDLSQLVALLSSRRNVIFAPISGLLLWATNLAFLIEAWRDRHGRHIPEWLDAIGEFEALAAIAGFAAEHPDYVFPTCIDTPAGTTPPRFAATALAHPLLPADAVANDIALGAPSPGLVLISGSNMSGKSTCLRTVGLTIVLAQMGAPVRASACTLSPLAIGASIRVLDSLQEGHSRFYAEILRLRHIVDLARRTHGRMIFLLDEMLSGTNSHDRRQGAEGILSGLAALGAIGLATTHDLALGAIVTAMGSHAEQRHFSDVFDAGTLQFDYRLRPGPVRASNAIALMRSVGLDVGSPVTSEDQTSDRGAASPPASPPVR